MNKITIILVLALFALVGVALCYFVLKLPIVVNTINGGVPKLDSGTLTLASIGGVGGAAGIAGLALNAYGKAKSAATQANQQLGNAKTELNAVKTEINSVKETAQTQINEVSSLKESALSQIEEQKKAFTQLQAEKDAAVAQANSLQKKLEEQPVKIVKVPV
jgi:hypothetical protein